MEKHRNMKNLSKVLQGMALPLLTVMVIISLIPNKDSYIVLIDRAITVLAIIVSIAYFITSGLSKTETDLTGELTDKK